MPCTSCDKTFPVKATLLQHRKNNHLESVQTCSNMISGFCKYGSEKCWFKHDKNDNNDNNEKQNDNEEVIEKIFQMMEKFIHQIVDIKEINNLK
jgi:hypothetical protein